MAGNGTFNLTAVWRALGIKNPTTSMRESVQPVLVVADMRFLVPQHLPPMNVFGGDVIGVAARFASLQVSSRGAGGCILRVVQSGAAPLLFRIDTTPEAGLVNVVSVAQLSEDPVETTLQRGTLAVAPGVAVDMPTMPPSGFNAFPQNETLFWVAPGQFLKLWNPAAGSSILDWTIYVQDVPASPN